MCGAAIAVDLLQAREIDLPSADDWGTCGISCGKSSCGLLAHRILQQVFDQALPSWDAMRPSEDDRDDDVNGLPARLKVQKKAWRAKMVLSDLH